MIKMEIFSLRLGHDIGGRSMTPMPGCSDPLFHRPGARPALLPLQTFRDLLSPHGVLMLMIVNEVEVAFGFFTA